MTRKAPRLTASLAYIQVQAHCLVMEGDRVVGRATMKPIDWFPGRGEDLTAHLQAEIDKLPQDALKELAGQSPQSPPSGKKGAS